MKSLSIFILFCFFFHIYVYFKVVLQIQISLEVVRGFLSVDQDSNLVLFLFLKNFSSNWLTNIQGNFQVHHHLWPLLLNASTEVCSLAEPKLFIFGSGSGSVFVSYFFSGSGSSSSHILHKFWLRLQILKHFGSTGSSSSKATPWHRLYTLCHCQDLSFNYTCPHHWHWHCLVPKTDKTKGVYQPGSYGVCQHP